MKLHILSLTPTDERTVLSFRMCVVYFAFAKLRAEIDNRSIITQMLPPTFHEAMQGNFRRMRTTILVKQTGLNRAQARPVLDRALSKVSLWPAPGSVDTRLS